MTFGSCGLPLHTFYELLRTCLVPAKQDDAFHERRSSTSVQATSVRIWIGIKQTSSRLSSATSWCPTYTPSLLGGSDSIPTQRSRPQLQDCGVVALLFGSIDNKWRLKPGGDGVLLRVFHQQGACVSLSAFQQLLVQHIVHSFKKLGCDCPRRPPDMAGLRQQWLD